MPDPAVDAYVLKLLALSPNHSIGRTEIAACLAFVIFGIEAGAKENKLPIPSEIARFIRDGKSILAGLMDTLPERG